MLFLRAKLYFIFVKFYSYKVEAGCQRLFCVRMTFVVVCSYGKSHQRGF